VSHKELRCFI